MIAIVNEVYINSNIYIHLNLLCIERYLLPDVRDDYILTRMKTYKVKWTYIFCYFWKLWMIHL